MDPSKENDVFVRVKDEAGYEFVCPLRELRSVEDVSEDELEDCFDGDVIGRYAGNLTIVDPPG